MVMFVGGILAEIAGGNDCSIRKKKNFFSLLRSRVMDLIQGLQWLEHSQRMDQYSDSVESV
jgi:hypothetical protein